MTPLLSEVVAPQFPPRQLGTPERVLMTLDAVGGVWRYALDLADQLNQRGIGTVFAGFGPVPGPRQVSEAERQGELIWFEKPLDWLTEDEAALDGIPSILSDVVSSHDIDLVHLNLPSQSYRLRLPVPVVVVSHSCVVTWFHAVRSSSVPDAWRWQLCRNRGGFAAADVVVAPSHAHAEMLEARYGRLDHLRVVHNGAHPWEVSERKALTVLAAGRWWDDGKNGAVLDAAASLSGIPVEMAGPLRGPAGQQVILRHASHLGELGHSELRARMARSAIVASPSLYEPFGLVALEGALSGAALVLSDIPTYRELWGGAALFADPHEPRAFAAAIDRLATDVMLRRQLAGAAWSRAARYSLPAQADAMLDIYADAICGRRAKPRMVS